LHRTFQKQNSFLKTENSQQLLVQREKYSEFSRLCWSDFVKQNLVCIYRDFETEFGSMHETNLHHDRHERPTGENWKSLHAHEPCTQCDSSWHGHVGYYSMSGRKEMRASAKN